MSGKILSACFHDDYLTALACALAGFNGLSFISPGDTVYLKVNSNSGAPYPYSTNPTLVEYVANIAKEKGASKIYVGDRSFFGDPNTLANLKQNGIHAAAERTGCKVVVFEDNTVEWVSFQEAQAPNWTGGFRLPKLVLDADHVINLPVVKTHFISTFTMGMKNMIGLVHPMDRSREGNLRTHQIPKLYSQIAEINKQIPPVFTILDGFEAVIQGGPTPFDGAGGRTANPGIVIASTDRIAADVFGLALLKIIATENEELHSFGCWDNPQIKVAIDLGLGVNRLEADDIFSSGLRQLDEIQRIMNT